MKSAVLPAVAEFLRGLPGVVRAEPLRQGEAEQVVQTEERYETAGLFPLCNLGVRAVAAREAAVLLLKDRHFREPPEPTVYLVEELPDGASDPGGGDRLLVEGRWYRILGEEVMSPGRESPEKVVLLSGSFAMYPERRSDSRAPSYFVLPPLGFPELEGEAERLGVREVISISPSTNADTLLRRLHGLPPDDTLATLIVAFNLAEPAGG